jgi:hypothetical protein
MNKALLVALLVACAACDDSLSSNPLPQDAALSDAPKGDAATDAAGNDADHDAGVDSAADARTGEAG